jgi:hypothetical protein
VEWVSETPRSDDPADAPAGLQPATGGAESATAGPESATAGPESATATAGPESALAPSSQQAGRALAELAGLADLELDEQPDAYQRIHVELQDALASIDDA